MRRKRFRKNKKTFITFLLILCISIGFAALSTVLRINGVVNVPNHTWDIYFTNIQPISGSVTPITAAKLTGKTSIDFETNLTMTGEYYAFTVDAVNNGTLDAMIGQINKTEFTAEQANILDFTICYENGVDVAINDKIPAGQTIPLTVTLKFKETATAEDFTDNNTLDMNFFAGIDYVKANENAVDVVTTR